jgi:hypothetical protein
MRRVIDLSPPALWIVAAVWFVLAGNWHAAGGFVGMAFLWLQVDHERACAAAWRRAYHDAERLIREMPLGRQPGEEIFAGQRWRDN